MTPHEMFDKMRQYWINGTGGQMWAEDIVVETPFARPGRPKRVVGARFREIAEQGRAALPATFEECNEIAVHETTDPEVIVVEYELVGTMNATGKRDSAQFIGVLRVRDDKVVLWREYQDTMKMVAAGF